MYGYIYLTTNLINNKKYYGQKASDVFNKNYKGSGKILQLAFKKYGKENFECHPVVWCESKKELDYAEHYFTRFYNCVYSNEYYNLKEGGSGGSKPGVVCITNCSSGEIKRVEVCELDNYLNSGEWYKKGHLQTEETREKIRKGNTGKIVSARTKEKQHQAMLGVSYGPLSKAHKEKLSKSCRENQPTNKKVRCKETGDIFISLHEAARKYNTCAPNIIRNINGGYSTRGYNWEYVD